MSDTLFDALDDLLRASLAMWSLAEEVQLDREAGQLVMSTGADTVLKISRAPNGMPFRWAVDVNGRKRTAASVVGVLRIVRQSLAPSYQPYQLTMAALPGNPS